MLYSILIETDYIISILFWLVVSVEECFPAFEEQRLWVLLLSRRYHTPSRLLGLLAELFEFFVDVFEAGAIIAADGVFFGDSGFP